MNRLLLPASIVLAVILAILGGFLFGKDMAIFGILGDLFLRLLKMMIVPLVLTSMVTGVLRMGDVRSLGRMGIYTLIYYMTTTGFAVLTGLIVSNFFQYDLKDSGLQAVPAVLPEGGPPSPGETLIGFIPENLFEAMVHMDILPLIFVALFFGVVLASLQEEAGALGELFFQLDRVLMKMVHLIVLISPAGIFGLLAGKLGQTGGGFALLHEIWQLRWYAGNVLLGLAVHSLVTLPLLYLLFTRRNPLSYIRFLLEPLIMAFSTSSSSATLPVTLESVEEAGVDPGVAGFVLPLGATINMDGTALYEAVAVMFIASVYGIPMDLTSQIVILLTATLAAVGAAGIPEAGLVTMVLVLHAVHLPVEGIGMILVIDWFLDRIRTTVNVFGDAIGAAIIGRHFRRERPGEGMIHPANS